jgi:hypothetical protein
MNVSKHAAPDALEAERTCLVGAYAQTFASTAMRTLSSISKYYGAWWLRINTSRKLSARRANV